MRRMLVPLWLGLMAAFMVASPVFAARGWCARDPMVMIDGDIANILAAAPLSATLKVTGPNQLIITVPEGVEAYTVFADPGFGRGWKITYRESSKLKRTANGIQLDIRLYVPATDSTMPVQLQFAPRIIGILQPTTVEGTANEWIVMRVVF